MNVLVLHSELGVLRGGGENFTRGLFSAFAARGHRVAAAFVADRRGHYCFPLPASLEPIPIRGWWSRNLGQGLFFALGQRFFRSGPHGALRARVQEAMSWRVIRWHNRRFARKVMRAVSDRLTEFDSIYVHGDLELAVAMSDHHPTVLRLPGPLSPDFSDLLRRVHVVCANGDALIRVRSFLRDRVEELPLGIDESLFRPGDSSLRQRFGWSQSDLVIGYVGRLTHVKGVDLLATAFRAISPSRPDLRLIIVGQGPAETSLRSLLAGEIALGAVRIEQDVDHDELPEWYRAMDLFVMPSRYENYSNAIVEAMGCGVPFLASAVGGNTALAKTTNGGWVFDAESVAALASSVGAVLSDAHELKRRGQLAARFVTGRYSWAHSAKVLETILACRVGAKT